MKTHIINFDIKLSKFFRAYLYITSFLINKIVLFFKYFNLPGLSRVLMIFNLLPTKNSYKLIIFNDNGEFLFPIFDYYYNMFFLTKRDYEVELLDLCNRINSNYVFFDGGANLGYISSSFIHLSHNCTSLIAIEPNTKLTNILKLNIEKAITTSRRLDFSFKILTNAISDVTKKNKIFKIGRHAGSSLAKENRTNQGLIYLDTICLNDLVEFYASNEFCIFKLDLEGAEFDALKSFNYFSKSIIIIEILNFENQIFEIKNICFQNNLVAFIYINEWIELFSITDDTLFSSKNISNIGLNLLLIPKDLNEFINV